MDLANLTQFRAYVTNELNRIGVKMSRAQKRYLLCLMMEFVYKQKMEKNLLIDVDLNELHGDYVGYMVHKFYQQAINDVPDTVEATRLDYLTL